MYLKKEILTSHPTKKQQKHPNLTLFDLPARQPQQEVPQGAAPLLLAALPELVGLAKEKKVFWVCWGSFF